MNLFVSDMIPLLNKSLMVHIHHMTKESKLKLALHQRWQMIKDGAKPSKVGE